MILYPTIELQNRHCVSLRRSDLSDPLIWHVDPVKKAHEFAEAGAEWMHITDFDAIAGRPTNADLMVDIIRHSEIPVQIAGGFRSMSRIDEWADKGAGRIVIGTAAVRNPEFVHQAAKKYPDMIVLAVDVLNDRVMTDGWRNESAFTPHDFVLEFDGAPLAGILYTDIGSDMGEGEGDVAAVSALADVTRTPVIASGVVRSNDDISRLKYVRNIAGAIIGRALFNKTIDLKKALKIARAEPEKTAAFI